MVSITFDNPQYLWFLFAVPLVVLTHFFMLRHAKRRAMKFANFVLLKRITGERLITKNYTILALRTLIILCAIFAVAQTHVWYEGKSNQNEYAITIDTSASMKAADFDPSRLDVAKIYAEQFVDALDPNTRAAVVSFSGLTFIEQALTTNRADLKDALRRLDATAAGTDIAGAIITSTNTLINVERGRGIILITDGSNTVEDFHSRSIQRAVIYAKANRVKIYTIGVGKDIKTPIGYLPSYYNVSASFNADNLIYIANETGGKYYAAEDNEALINAYNDIKSADQTSTLSLDLTGGLMLVTLMLLMAEWGLINTRFRMLP
jgi:Ca-activated chloride channel family protein